MVNNQPANTQLMVLGKVTAVQTNGPGIGVPRLGPYRWVCVTLSIYVYVYIYTHTQFALVLCVLRCWESRKAQNMNLPVPTPGDIFCQE